MVAWGVWGDLRAERMVRDQIEIAVEALRGGESPEFADGYRDRSKEVISRLMVEPLLPEYDIRVHDEKGYGGGYGSALVVFADGRAVVFSYSRDENFVLDIASASEPLRKEGKKWQHGN